MDLPGLGVQGEAECGKDCPELRVGGDRGVADAVDRLDHVAHAHRVQAPPCTGREDAGVDLEMQMPMRVAGPRRVVPDHRRLDPLHRHLDLPPTRTNPGRRVLRDPPDDLLGRPILSRVERLRHLGMQCRGQRPGLRPVDGDFDKPQRFRILADPPLLATGVGVEPSDPLLVGLPVHRPDMFEAVRGCLDPGREASPLGEVVVIRARVVALDIGARGLRRAPVELHPAMHPDHRLNDVRRQPTDP